MHRPRIRAALLLLAGVLWLPGTARAGGTDAPAGFAGFERAWRAGAAGAVVRSMDSRGTARFTLHAYPLSGKSRSMKPRQAKASLKAYFGKLAGIRLEDATPPRSPASVRLYEYTYKPDREDARTTHLQVRLKRDRKRRWVLASVTESAKPRD